MKLRGHHVFCTALFSGHGYGESFAGKMAAVIERWKQGEPAEIVEGRDEVCSACPNRLNDGGCLLGTGDVRRRDGEALAMLGVSPAEKLSWAQAGEKLSHLTEKEFQQVCSQCRWQREGLCTFDQLQKSANSRKKRLC